MTVQWENYTTRPKNWKAWAAVTLATLCGVNAAGEALFESGTTFGLLTSLVGVVTSIGLMGHANQSGYFFAQTPKPAPAAPKK